ncbi:VOC family protein [Kineosporia succinea]|uniref:Enzyme related to lactoylglutathione lyase n=1 Tax=Kineosporia succinea TaxID=84632 RepID=A0ABT9PAF5_9ACTN|nr:VOC family protein [Kineosporia succinea]MDP9829663.1 putative enzyme related to lactoylglutathione lyase [Kineosporia succinea]
MSENTPSSATPGWFDISTPDSPRSRAFYGDLFGWAVQGLDDNFAMVSGGEGQPPAGSIATAVEGSPYVGLVPYFPVADIEQSLAQAEKLGAEVLMTVRETPTGRIAAFKDPDGNVVGLMG